MDSGTHDGWRPFKSAGCARPRKLTLLVLEMQHAHELQGQQRAGVRMLQVQESVNTSAAATQQWDNKLTCGIEQFPPGTHVENKHVKNSVHAAAGCLYRCVIHKQVFPSVIYSFTVQSDKARKLTINNQPYYSCQPSIVTSYNQDISMNVNVHISQKTSSTVTAPAVKHARIH